MSTSFARRTYAETLLILDCSFLDGIKWNCGDVDVRLKGPKACARAVKVVLDSPSHIVVHELEFAIVTTQTAARSSEDNEGEFDQAPN